jgi:hypothetical protein
MQSPFTDPTLSLRARGLLALCLSVGRVPTEDELNTAIPEGRDAIRNAKRELVSAGYLIKEKFRIKGQFRTEYYLNQAWFTVDGFSGPLYNCATVANSSSYIINGITNVIPLIGAQAPQGSEGEYMSWPGLDEPEATPSRRPRIDDDDSGAVGKIIDPAKNRAKKKRRTTKVEMFPEAKRLNIPEEDWGTQELVAEFYMLLRDKASGVPDQVNAKTLASWINKHVGDGVTRLAILKAMRMFFADPRNFHDLGIGKSVMERFMAYYRTVHGIVSRTQERSYVDDDVLAHQEKMLKLLGGE